MSYLELGCNGGKILAVIVCWWMFLEFLIHMIGRCLLRNWRFKERLLRVWGNTVRARLINLNKKLVRGLCLILKTVGGYSFTVFFGVNNIFLIKFCLFGWKWNNLFSTSSGKPLAASCSWNCSIRLLKLRSSETISLIRLMSEWTHPIDTWGAWCELKFCL